jgi:predicted HTH transcriptional regulator
MNISPEEFNKNKFDYNESDCLEFKESFQDNLLNKYIETICGFLNSGGGKLIFGIKDNLFLVGLKNTTKELDKFILRIDAITGNKQIIGINKEMNRPISIAPTCIKTNLLTNVQGKKFIIVDIIPEINILYQLINGRSYYRLGASNYFNRCETFYSESQYNDKCNNYKIELEKENIQNIDKFTKIIKNKEEEITRLEIQNKHLLNDNKEISIVYDSYIQNTVRYIQLQQIPAYNYLKQWLSDCYPN